MTTALTLESTLQVVAWGDEVENPAPAGQIRHVDVTGVAVINDPANGPKYTKVVASIFVAMDEAERNNVDKLTPTAAVQRILVPGVTTQPGTGWLSIFLTPRVARPVVAGDYRLSACFEMKMETGPEWDADGADSAAEARITVNGVIRRTWVLPLAYYDTRDGFISDTLVEGTILTIDFEINRKGAAGVIKVRDVVLELERTTNAAHDVE